MILRTQGMRALLSGAVLLFAVAASAEKLQQVEIRSAGEAARIVLHVDGVVTHKSFTLSNPERLVVDLVGVQNALQVATRSVPGGPVKHVRVAQFATDPQPVTRVVADLRGAASHKVERQGDNLIITVTPKSAKAPAAPSAVAGKTAVVKVVPRVADAAAAPTSKTVAQPRSVQSVQKDAEDTVSQVFPVPVLPVKKSASSSDATVKTVTESNKLSAGTATEARVADQGTAKPGVSKATAKRQRQAAEKAKLQEGKKVAPTVAAPVVDKVVASAQSKPSVQAPVVDKAVATSTKTPSVQTPAAKPVASVPEAKVVKAASATTPVPAAAVVPRPVPVQTVPRPVAVVSTVPATPTDAGSIHPSLGDQPQEKGKTAHTWRSQTASAEDTSPKLNLQSSNRRINLDVQGADIRTVLRTLADYAGMNIIASREVQGEVSASLKDAPWESALEAILRAHGYGYVQENGIIRVGNLERIRNEELEEAAAARKREDLLPIETRVARMEFANAAELKGSLQEMMTGRGNLQVDERTNALIISDIPARVELIAQMARELDSRTPQVEIVSKIVDVSDADSKNLGIQWSAANIMKSDVLASAGVSALTSGAVGGMRLGTVQSWGQLDAMIDALASAKKANVISNPTITTVNNREAKILVGSKIPLIVADEAGNAITQLTTIGISMRVTPHVNSDKTISLDLHPEISELSSQATVQGGVIINTSEADTRVIVQDGETAIIGGLIRDIQSSVKTGIPVLQDMPLVGWLFRNSNVSNEKREMIIFVTPRMVSSGE